MVGLVMNPTRWLALFFGIIGGLLYADLLRSCETHQLQAINSAEFKAGPLPSEVTDGTIWREIR
jgi:hypothetical protein